MGLESKIGLFVGSTAVIAAAVVACTGQDVPMTPPPSDAVEAQVTMTELFEPIPRLLQEMQFDMRTVMYAGDDKYLVRLSEPITLSPFSRQNIQTYDPESRGFTVMVAVSGASDYGTIDNYILQGLGLVGLTINPELLKQIEFALTANRTLTEEDFYSVLP